MTAPARYSIVVPCFNTASAVDLVSRICRVLEARSAPYEVLLINDASPNPATWTTLREIALANDRVRAFDLQFNVGQFRALMFGLERSRGEIVVTIDDDLQHPPEEITKLLDALDAEPETDVVIGAYESKNHSVVRNLGSRLFDHLFRSSYGKPAGLRLTSFRALRRPVVNTLLGFKTMRPIPGAMLLQSTSRIRNVPVVHAPRAVGRSGWRPASLVTTTLDNLIAGSVLPLRAISLLGLMVSILAGVLAMAYFIAYVVGAIRVQGFTTIVLLIILFGGLTLASIGVVGEYLARVVGEVTAGPRFAVREMVEGAHQTDDPA